MRFTNIARRMVAGNPLVLGLRRRTCSRFGSAPGHLLVHASHHKAGSLWFQNVLSAVAWHYGLRFVAGDRGKVTAGPGVFLDYDSRVDLSRLPPYRGSHLIRDPRDIVVSGYYYHLWTKEKWANTPSKEYGGKSYRALLSSLPKEEGLLVEMQRASNWDIRHIVEWDYTNPLILELKYEDVIRDEESAFRSLFAHYGFDERAVAACTEIAARFSFRNVAGRRVGQVRKKSHLRSGRPKQWQAELGDVQKARFKQLHGEDLIRLGYEKDLDW